MRWARLANGQLLNAAELAGFEVFVTAGKNLYYQQHLKGRKIALVVCRRTTGPNSNRRCLPSSPQSIPTAGSFCSLQLD
jgi:hypothetical protein